MTAGFTWKRMGRFSWTNSYYPATGHIRNRDDYVDRRDRPAITLSRCRATGATYDPGEAAGKPWYVLATTPTPQAPPTRSPR